MAEVAKQLPEPPNHSATGGHRIFPRSASTRAALSHHVHNSGWLPRRKRQRGEPSGDTIVHVLREHYDRNVWTFSKGRPQPDETPREAALRKTREETGVFAEIVDRIPGTFRGT